MLSNKEIALLATKLQVPVIVADILKGEAELSDDVHYALHELISDMQPDSGLLAIALSAAHVASIYKNASAGIKVLGMEASRIIEDYGTIWLQNARNEMLDGEKILDTLMHTPEDLESLAELLELSASFLKAKDKDAASICNILLVQANAHAMIAEEFIAAAYKATETKPGELPTFSVFTANNVIPFPATSVR